MRLHALRLNGFKTFASPTTIEFSRGMTAIVGANGSGKSNLVDAIRWVLGEQSMRDLRGRRAEDVIFSGSSERRPSGMAEVTVTFDNDEGWLSVDAAEVEVARRIFRSGESEYLINRQRTRLRDVTDMLRISGLAGTGHTIIGQGLVDAILSARGIERYGLVSAVAGVAPYELRRAEALHRLQETRSNLADAHVFLTELEPRLRLLKRQTNIVRNAARARQDLEAGLARHYAHTRDRCHAEREELRVGLKCTLRDIDTCRAEIERLEQAALAERATADAIRRRHEQAERAVFTAEHELQRSLEREGTLREAFANADRGVRDLRARTETLVGRLSVEDDRLREQEELLSALKAEVATRSQALRALLDRRSQLEELATKRARDCDAARQLRTETARAAAQHREEAERLERRAAELRGNMQALHQRILECDHGEAAIHRSFEAAGLALETAQEEFEREQAALSECTDAAVAARTRYTESQGLYAARVHSLGTARREYNDLLASRTEKLGPGRTPVIQTLRFAPEYAAAVAAALDPIGELDSTPSGDEPGPRTAACPPAEWRARIASALSAGAVECYGWLGDVVRYCDDHSTVRALLDTTLLVRDTENLDRAWSHVASLEGLPLGFPPLRLVTADGRIRGAGFMLAATHEAVVAAHREAVIEELRLRLPDLEVACDAATRSVEEARSAQRSCDEALDAAEARVRKARQVRAAAEAALEAQRFRLDANRSEIAAHRAALASRSTELDDAENAATRARTEWSTAEASLQVQDQEVAAMAARLTEIREALATEDRARADAETSVQLLRRQLDLERVERDRRESNRLVIEQELEQSRARLARSERRRAEHEPAIAEAAAKVAESAASLDRARHELDSMRDEQSPRNPAIDSHEQEIRALRADLERLLSELERLRSRIGYLDVEIDRTTEDCLADLGCTLEAVASAADAPVPTELEIRRLRVKAEQAEDLDPGVVTEYADMAARRDTLLAQIADLEAAGTGLEEIVHLADRDVQRLFRQAFADVGSAFARHFRSMFGGGAAELVLCDDEGSRSVDILAQPPRKRSRDLSALSGGERTLTASAFLFALISTHPPPFCVLDEVDAALDESNVDRYAQTLRELAGDTQFVLVTHNRATMAAADFLYGITLGSDATSRVLSVRLSELAS